MKPVILACLLLPAAASGADFLDAFDMEYAPAEGTASEISRRARSCLADAVPSAKPSANPDSGPLVAEVSAAYTQMLVEHVVRSTMTVVVEEGRLRTSHAGIEYAVGSGKFERVPKRMGSGWQKAKETLERLSAKLAACARAEAGAERSTPIIAKEGAMEPEFVYTLHPIRPDMLASGPNARESEIIDRHFKYLQYLTARGVVLMAGRTLTTDERSFGVVVFHAADAKAAAALAASDPAVKDGVMRAEVLPFKVALRAK